MTGILRPKPGFRCGPRALLVLTEPDLRYWQKAWAFPQQKRLFLSEIHYGPLGALAGPALGAPQAAMLMENLIAAGAREFLVYGWAGALDAQVPLGSLWVVEKAFSAEGTAPHYLAQESFSWRPSPWLRSLLQKIGPGQATVVSTDAPYRETPDFCRKWASLARLIDMETSALYALAHFYQVSMAVLLVVSDRVWPVPEKASRKILTAVRRGLTPVFSSFWEE